jgi:hypothetical protein
MNALLLTVAMVFGLGGVPDHAASQTPPPEMCGDGTTTVVHLPGTSLGIDDSDGLFRTVNVPTVGPPDSIAVPNGCALYVLLVSGYHQNEHFDRITFYKVAEFAAKNNGYVHVAWWNNLLAPYMERPLHGVDIWIERTFRPDLFVPPNPGGYDPIQREATLLPGNFVDLPKANPDEDYQFQSDAAVLIRAIKASNPNAIVVVAGHSMGADSVARLGRVRDLPIDLLAVIDPGNNRDKPRGLPGTPNFNWTRWRATHEFLGFRSADCIRGSGGLFCHDFDPRPFRIERRCEPLGRPAATSTGWFVTPPLIPSLHPLFPRCDGPIMHQGIRHTIGNNVRRLYHRWQHEFIFPFDFHRAETFLYPAPPSNSILGPNYQKPILPNVLTEGNPDKTCASVLDDDPRRGAGFKCGPFDGHGEIVGMRAPQDDLLNPLADLEGPGLIMRNWTADPGWRRAFMAEMATADSSWPQRPADPDTCMVCDDIIAITQHLLDERRPAPADDVTAPVTVATADPGPADSGWHNDDVLISLAASDEPGGSGVKEIEFTVGGAQLGGGLQPGGAAETSIGSEGISTVTFFARDHAGNVESPAKTRVVNLDKTPPVIETVVSPAPNTFGWNKTDVTVSFNVTDALSGVAEQSPAEPILVTAEGAGQEIVGSATDAANNQASAAAVVSLDRTSPEMAGVPDRGPDSNGWYNHALTVHWHCTDELSGVQSVSVPANYGGPDTVAASVSGSCFDSAENHSPATMSFQFDSTAPVVVIATPADGAAYLLNAAIAADFACSDALSGVASCDGPAADGAPVNTSTVGERLFAVISADVAGNTAASAHRYGVRYAFSGFFSPISPMPMANVVRAGRTVPVKYRLQDAVGASISDLASFASLTSGAVACGTASAAVEVQTVEAAGSTTIRYDPGADQFVYNWKTDAAWAGSCRLLQLTLNDGTTRLALFEFR